MPEEAPPAVDDDAGVFGGGISVCFCCYFQDLRIGRFQYLRSAAGK